MCVGLVCRVTAVHHDRTVDVVDESGRALTASLLAIDDAVADGDWLLVHSGFALARLEEADAVSAIALQRSGEESA